MEANPGSDEAIKSLNVNYGKKLKQWSDEAFNAGKEIEAIKLHRIASSLLLPSFDCNTNRTLAVVELHKRILFLRPISTE